MTSRFAGFTTQLSRSAGGWITLVYLVTACGAPRPTGESDAASTGASEATTSTGEFESGAASTSSSTGMQTGCWRHVVGDLVVDDNADLELLGQVVSVDGIVYIDFEGLGLEDLSSLGCLERAGGLQLHRCIGMTSTAGMLQLVQLGGLLVEGSCIPSLIGGFDGLTELGALTLDNPKASRVEFPTLERINIITYGWCSDSPDTDSPLVSFGAFDSLAEVEQLWVFSMATITDLTILDALIANGAPPLKDARFQKNISIPEAEIIEKLDLIGTESRQVCGNLEGAPCEQCPPPS
jgi:hypothetical protein